MSEQRTEEERGTYTWKPGCRPAKLRQNAASLKNKDSHCSSGKAKPAAKDTRTKSTSMHSNQGER